jgi:hypothetical protein
MGFDDGYHKGFRTDFPDANPQYKHYYNVGYDRGIAKWAVRDAEDAEVKAQPLPEPLRKYKVNFHTISEQSMTVMAFDAEDACQIALDNKITDLPSTVIDQQWDIVEVKK